MWCRWCSAAEPAQHVADAGDGRQQPRHHPEEGRTRKNQCDHRLALARRTQLGDLLIDHRASAGQFGKIEAIEESRHQHPGDQDEAERERHAQDHPFQKTDLASQFVGGIACDDCVGGTAEQRAEATDARRPGNGEHQADAELAHILVAAQKIDLALAVRLSGGAAAVPPLCNQREQRKTDRQHHQRGCGVRHPHRQEPGGQHHAQHDPVRRYADAAQRHQRDAAVEIPFFHRDRDQEPAQKQEHDRTGIGRGRLCHRTLGQRGDQHDGQH